jgi:hypothetical protein
MTGIKPLLPSLIFEDGKNGWTTGSSGISVGSIEWFVFGRLRVTNSGCRRPFQIGSDCPSTLGLFGYRDAMSGISAPTVRNIPAEGNAHGMG